MTDTTAKAVNIPRRPVGIVMAPRSGAIVAFFMFEVFFLVILQKIGIPISNSIMEVSLPAMYLGFVLLFFSGRVRIDLVRMILYVLFGASAVVCSYAFGGYFSLNSLYLVLALYLPFIFVITTDISVYKRCISMFITLMIIAVLVEIAQHLVQVVGDWKMWPNLDKMVPKEYLFSGYVYIQGITPLSKFMKPNSIVFLEVSFLSQFIAIALSLELVYFRRIWVMALLSAGLLLTFAGTGVLLMLVCAPILLGRIPFRFLPAVFVVGAIVAAIAVKVGWYEQVQHRITEYQSSGSSAHERFVAPANLLMDFLKDPETILTGNGPGNIDKSGAGAWWPLVKVTYEYGIVTSVLFFSFLGYCLFRAPPSRAIAFTLLLFYSFLGAGFATPVYGYALLVFSSMFQIAPVAQRRGAAEARGPGGRIKSPLAA